MTLLVGELEAMEAELLAQDLDGDEFEVNHLDPDALLADLRLDESDAGDEVTGWLDATLARVGDLAVGGNSIDDASRIDRIAVLERIKASVTAAQAVEIVAFGRSQVQAQRDAGVDLPVGPRHCRPGRVRLPGQPERGFAAAEHRP